MKKTLVAVAAMAAVTGAMADVTIGGLIDAAAYSITTTNSDSARVITRGVGPQNNGTDELFFATSEDLGNGLKANARLGFNATASGSGANTTSAGTSNMSNRISYVGVSSASFGEVQAGQQWKPGFFAILNLDPTGLVSTSGAGLVGPGDMAAYTANSITYTSPSFNGVGFQYQKGYGETAGNTAGDSSGYRLDYTNAGLYVVYSAGTTALSSTGTFKGNTIGTVQDTLLTATALGTSVKSSGYGASYDFGMAKVSAGAFSSTAGSVAKSNSTAYGLSAPVGPFVLAVSMSSGQQVVASTAVSTSTKGQRYSATYPLSKRTSVYAFTGTSTAGTVRRTTESALGVKHTF